MSHVIYIYMSFHVASIFHLPPHLVPLFTGFDNTPATPKIIQTRSTISSKKTFVGIGKAVNDVNKPEFDDQGYTIYTDEETGKKSRVFEALIDYPSVFKIKIIGRNESSFASEMVQIVADSCQVDVEKVEFSERVNGKWLSLTVHAPVENAEMVYSLYENVDKDPRVKFKF
jgi:putative lipoic acid-binding regulatory protein